MTSDTRGTVGILNVGAGDTKISFDKRNPAERLRAARIVTDMLRRGYALMVEVGSGRKKHYERVLQFDEAHCEYVVADFDSAVAEAADREPLSQPQPGEPQAQVKEPVRGRRVTKTRKVAADSTHAISVARSAGG